MKTISLHTLSPDVRSFLAQSERVDSLVVEDEAGRARYGVIPYIEHPAAEQEAALRDLETIQRQVGKTMKKHGRTEDDFDHLLQSE
jgi:hypothetical protein